MENNVLQFTSKARLLSYLNETDVTSGYVDLENHTFAAAFLEEEIEFAISKFGAFVFAESVIY